MAFSWKRNLFVLWIGSFFVSSAYCVSIPFLPIFLHDQLGVQDHLETWTGVTFAVTFLASALIAPFWGSLADRYGRKPMMIRAGICLTITYLLYFLVQNPYELIGVRIMEGLLAGYIPATVALVATNTPENHAGYALGILSTSTAAGSIIGPLVGGVVSQWLGNRETFLVSSGLVFIAFFIAIIWVNELKISPSTVRRNVAGDLKEAASNRGLMILLGITLAVSASVMIIEPLLTAYVLKLGADQKTATLSSGIIFSAVGIATLIAAPIWGKIGERIGYGKVLFIGLVGGGIGSLLQIAFHDLVSFGVLRFIYGFFFAAVYPALSALIVRATDPGFRGRAFSLNQASTQMGTMLGPVVGGFLANLISIYAVFLINGASMLIISLLIRKRKFAARTASPANADPVPRQNKAAT
ncbi:MFS transporter [Paenibacillus solisilvae]|uniref:MFS transporter n=1 Tax=Paenibacillus solisilvae TaxID=2486751 RepID=A0ABW0VYX2_9BACL